ncbi:hypothetical protein SKAU_G00352410 [Synaphobranchus kaupii]|uniref:Reverse transcriptase/retrotransposon-derived protein RNase H-like domain-containing protein n=1 Tax=Synaphobranchus kaupii TaxID=118154 RepID=A0A9Q1EKV7_SYNKA|nr:hypothetical protein SKAU_G00352410 [Synaphobranchus kaupii]
MSRPLTELLKKDTDFVWGQSQEQAVQELKRKLCMATCLAYLDKDREFYMEASFSQHCLSAALSQKHDQDKRVVAYASRALSSVELKFSDCEKALLTTIWALEHFRSYIGGQKIIIETCHQPVTFLNSQRLREGRVSNSRIAAWMMALQGYEVEVKYAQNHKMASGQGLAECQHCDSEVQPQEHLTVVTALSWPSNHHFYDDNDPVLKTIYQFVSDPEKYQILPESLEQVEDLNSCYNLRQNLKIEKGLLAYASGSPNPPRPEDVSIASAYTAHQYVTVQQDPHLASYSRKPLDSFSLTVASTPKGSMFDLTPRMFTRSTLNHL